MLTIPGYTVHSLLGEGGMAKVYLATQNSLNRQVAIKVLLNPRDAQFSKRFMFEAKTIALLNHPRVITIYDVSQLPDGCLYFSMEYLNGGDMRQFKGEILEPIRALGFASQIAEGLAVIHRKKIIHRDVKPANILFRDPANLVLSDFGIAKHTQIDSDLTQEGGSIGSPSYASPEQTTEGILDHRADIYSLGVVLLELLLGYNPYLGANVTETAINHLQMDIPILPDSLQQYQSLMDRMLAKLPEQRFESADALLLAIDSALVCSKTQVGGTLSAKRLLARIYGLGEACKRVHTAKWIFAVFVLLGLTALLFSLKYESETDRKINVLLEAARLSQEEARFDAPEQNNAFYYFNEVLFLDSANRAAKAGLKQLRKLQISYYLDRAEKSVEHQDWDDPEKDSAIYFYKEVLRLEPDDVRAKKGLANLTELYIESAQKAFLEKDYRQAFSYLRQGLLLDPKNEILVQLQNDYRHQSNALKRLINRVFK